MKPLTSACEIIKERLNVSANFYSTRDQYTRDQSRLNFSARVQLEKTGLNCKFSLFPKRTFKRERILPKILWNIFFQVTSMSSFIFLFNWFEKNFSVIFFQDSSNEFSCSFLLSLTCKYRKYCFWVKLSKWRFWWIYTFWGLSFEDWKVKITFLAFGLCM